MYFISNHKQGSNWKYNWNYMLPGMPYVSNKLSIDNENISANLFIRYISDICISDMHCSIAIHKNTKQKSSIPSLHTHIHTQWRI